MKKIDAKISTMISRLCAFLLALMGFSCSSLEVDDEGEMLLMYGCPTGSYEIKGMVSTDEGLPVRDAIIKVTYDRAPSNAFYLNSDTTDAKGYYTAEGRVVSSNMKIMCLPPNDSLEPDSTTVELEYVKTENKDDSFWYIGHAEATVNFTLKKKQDKK